jgi:hypothetical protein
MQRYAVLCLMAAAWLLAGCNQPAVTVKAFALQSSENTVRDWDDIAQAIAAGLVASGLLPKPGWQVPATVPVPVFIRVCAPDSTFIRAVADSLASDVLASGGTVARTAEGATVVNLDVTLLAWGPRDKPPGLIGLGVAFLGIGPVSDLIVAMIPTMNAEAIWDATVMTGDRVVMKLREPVYIRQPDIPLYAKVTSLGPVASWGSGDRLPVRRVRYDP